jgi:hypothetical protein
MRLEGDFVSGQERGKLCKWPGKWGRGWEAAGLQDCEAQFFVSEFNIRLYDKNSESDFFFFPPPKSEYIFQQHWESEYFFRKKP